MTKKWIKFLKEYTDKEDNSFEKDQVIELDENIAKSLVDLAFAEETDEPKADPKLEKAFEKIAETLEKKFELTLTKAMDSVGDKLQKKLSVIVKEPEEGLSGFENEDHFFRSIVKHANGDIGAFPDAYQKMLKAVPSGMTTIDDSSAGTLIPDTIAGGIWDGMMQDVMNLLSRTDQRFTGGNNLKIKRMVVTDQDLSTNAAGVISYWTDEAEAYTKSKPEFGDLNLYLHKLTVLVYVTDEMLSDSGTQLGPIISRLASRAINQRVNGAFIVGQGVGKPKGLLNEDALIVVDREENQTDNSILHSNINKMYYRMLPDSRSKAVWHIHPNLEEKLNLLQFNDNTSVSNPAFPIYFPPGGLTQSPFGTMMGRPVIPTQYCRDLGQMGDILFADWTDYATLQKSGGGIKSSVSMHVRFLFDEQVFKFSFRIGGGSLWSGPVQDQNGTTKRSPYITLENRRATAGDATSGL